MNLLNKLSVLGGSAWQTMHRYPVELALVTYAFFAAALAYHGIEWPRFKHGAALVPVFFTIAYILNTADAKRRWIYYLSWIAIVPLSFLPTLGAWYNSSQFLITTFILCPLAVLLSRRQREDDRFADDAVVYAASAGLALLFATIVLALFMAIYHSVVYIFALTAWRHIWFYAPWLIMALLGALLFLDFLSDRLGRRPSAGHIGTIIANYILTPALLIYTAILYIYAAKILFSWELPRGGVAIMVFAFCIVAVLLRAVQHLLARRIYDRFFDNLPLVTLPTIVLFWVGVAHRIADYGLTELRVYLVACGAIMTITMVLLSWRKRGVYLLVTIISFAIFATLAYVEPLSAERLAELSQDRRAKSVAVEATEVAELVDSHAICGQSKQAYNIAGYSLIYDCESYMSPINCSCDETTMTISTEDDSDAPLHLTIALDDILRTQLALIDRTPDNPPTEDEIDNAIETLLFYRTATLAIWFSYMQFEYHIADDGSRTLRLTDAGLDKIATK